MNTTDTIIELLDNGVKRFISEEEFVKFCQLIFHENESHDTPLNRPETYLQSIEYLRLYCDNITVIDIPVKHKIVELEELARKSYNLLCHLKGNDQQAEEAEANAKLIAAAPDLLEALQELTQAGDIDHYITSYNKAKQAIQKATL
jgi:hypothetical protein